MISRVEAVNYAWGLFFEAEPPAPALAPAPEPFKAVGNLPNTCWVCSDELFDLTQKNEDDTHPPLGGRKVVAHKKCPPLHEACLQRMDQQALAKEGCPTCREPLQAPAPAPIPAPLSLKSYAIAQIQWGIAQGARGLLRVSGAVLYSLFWTAIMAGGAIALNAVVDSDPTRLLIAGPIIGGLAGSAFGAALVAATCHVVFGVGSHLIEKMRAMAKVRFKQPGQIAVTLLLSGVAAVLAWKVGVLAGTLLTADWIKHCLPPCDVPSLLESMWKFTMARGLSVGLTELCVVTLAQIELFEVAAIGWGVFTWGRRAFFEELPRPVRA